jgi:hypothetical protein
MDNKNEKASRNRRWFFSLFSSTDKEKVKMLTADGQLVEVDKAVYEAAMQHKKASNKDILDWMENPSKEK